MFDLKPAGIDGCVIITPHIHEDGRGRFVKVFQSAAFIKEGLETKFVEEYYSESSKGVLRGMHYQRPPYDHVKLVYCSAGRVLDAVIDLRTDSRTFGKSLALELDAERPQIIYIPRGLAHGFFVLSKHAIMNYKTTSLYAPSADTGVHWGSVAIEWPDVPVTSPRDATLESLEEYAREPAF